MKLLRQLGKPLYGSLLRKPLFTLVSHYCACLFRDERYVYVVVIFLSQVIFVFLLFLSMVMYANEVQTKEK